MKTFPTSRSRLTFASDGLERIQFGNHELHPWQNGSVLINYVGPYHSYPHYSMVDVLQGNVPADAFRDKIVFFGGTALGIGDLRNTPFKQGSGYMGVEVHANILDNLLHTAEPGRTFLIRGFREEIVDIAFIILFRPRPGTAGSAALVP
jgi:adenylate cyclase